MFYAEGGSHLCPGEVDQTYYYAAALCAAINLLALASDDSDIAPTNPAWLGEDAYHWSLEQLVSIAWDGFGGVEAPPFDIGEDDAGKNGAA